MPAIIQELPGRPRTESGKSIEKAVECALCAESVKYFATQHAWIQNQNTKQVEKWKPWTYLLDLFDIIQAYDLIYILKASQLGISWAIAIYNLWVATFNETAKCLLLSQGQTEAADLLSKVNFVHKNLPEYMKLSLATDNRDCLSFKNSYAEIRALPSTPKAGHGYQASLVARDELARHDYARENFKAVSRAVDSGGKLIELSTANKEDQDNYFGEKTLEFFSDPNTVKEVLNSGIELYTNPNRPKSCMVFLGWKLRPTRYEGMTLEEWYDSRIKTRYTPAEIEEQYPTEITDVFKASLTRAYFDMKALEDMGYEVCHPMKQVEVDTFNGAVRVYKIPVLGRKYIVYTDPSDGAEDPFVTGVMDYVTGEVVASATGMFKVDYVAKIHNYLVEAYGNAVNSYEYNAVGMAFAQCVVDTPNQAPRRKPDGKADLEKKGQFISREYKNKMLGDLAFLITKRQITCHDREFVQQAKMVQRDDGGFPVTEKKLTFDWVMMMGGLGQLQKHVPHGDYQIMGVSYGGSSRPRSKLGRWR